MKQLFFITVFILPGIFNTAVIAQSSINFSDANQRLSYSLGNIIGNEIKRKHMRFNESVVRKGFQDSQNNITPLIDTVEVRRLTNDIHNQILLKMGMETANPFQSRHQIYTLRKRSGDSFMNANKHRNGVVTLPSGIQYLIITKGNGDSPAESDFVEIEFQTHSIDGKPVAYAGPEGETRKLQVNTLIKGLAEAVQLMQPGAEWEVYIPPELAYGHIRQYAHVTVIANVKLISVY